ncbi:MAG: hypothetical protein AB7O74_10670 [Candidatus Nanopelagicales bacterium]
MSRAVAVLIAVVGLTAACSGGDSDTFEVRIVNDTGSQVSVAQCTGEQQSCESTEQAEALEPGGYAIAVATSNAANPWRVTDARGKLLGCLPLDFDGYPDATPKVLVSSASPTQC